MRRLLYTLMLISLLISNVFAGPVDKEPVKVKQPDGKEILLKSFGDEFYHFKETIDGYTVLKNNDGYWVYAEKENSGKLIATNIIVNPTIERKANEINFLTKTRKHLRESEERVLQKTSKNSNSIQNYKSTDRSLLKTNEIRVIKFPVILIEFSDFKHKYSKQDFDDYFNKPGWNKNGYAGSFADYFDEISDGKIKIEADVYEWVADQNNRSYYAWHGNDAWGKTQSMVSRAIQAMDSEIDFSKYDNNGDGYVDHVVVFHAGQNATEGGDTDYIWAHQSWIPNTINLDGKNISKYIISGEIQYGRITGVGMPAHEFGHALGLPDLYDYGSGFVSQGVGEWDIMSGGAWNNWGRTPSHFSPWCKKELGILEPTYIESSGDYKIDFMEQDNSNIFCYKIPGKTKEYFYIENRKKTGWDSHIPGEGLLIWHIDENQNNNTDETHKLVDLESADGKDDMDKDVNGGDSTDPFPAAGKNRSFTSYSYPNSNAYDGSLSLLNISEISDVADIMTAKINIDGTAAFQTNSRTGHLPLEVQFADSSKASSKITSWKWDFNNDGVIDSEEQNPVHTYNEEGTFTVSLEVSNGINNFRHIEENYIKVFNGESSLQYSEITDYSFVPVKSYLNMANSFTFETWINASNWGWVSKYGNGVIFDKKYIKSYINRLYHDTKKIKIQSYAVEITDDNDQVSYWSSKPATVKLNQWQHYALTYNAQSGELNLFIDGRNAELVKVKGEFSGNIKDNNRNALILGNTVDKNQAFEGRIDEILFWENAKDSSEISKIKDKYLSGDEEGILSYWNCNEGSDRKFYDIINDAGSFHFGQWNFGIKLSDNLTNIEDREIIPVKFELKQNYPNPFNPSTVIPFSIKQNCEVELTIFNLLGEKITTLVKDNLMKGNYKYKLNMSDYSSGIYIYRLKYSGVGIEQATISKKMIFLK